MYQSVIFGPHDSYWATGQQGTEINPDYFKNELDRKMAYIADSGLVNAFGIGFHSNIDGFVQGSERLAAYVAARYGAYPVIWITSGKEPVTTWVPAKPGLTAGGASARQLTNSTATIIRRRPIARL